MALRAVLAHGEFPKTAPFTHNTKLLESLVMFLVKCLHTNGEHELQYIHCPSEHKGHLMGRRFAKPNAIRKASNWRVH